MDYNTQNKEDEDSRFFIVDNISKNYFVEAGAGSGKTTQLVERMVKLIEEKKKIEHICAITFTKAAANEFYERFQEALIKKVLLNDKNKELYQEALNNIDLAFMGTIDSFCNTIMSEHPNEGLIPSSAMIISEDKANELYEREYTNILNGKYNDSLLDKKAQDFIKYNQQPKETFILTLQELLNHRDCELVIPSFNIEDIDIKFKDEIKTIRKIVDILNKHPAYIKASNKTKEEEFIKAINNYKYIFDGKWNDNINNIATAFNKTFIKAYSDDKGVSDFRLCYAKEIEDELKEGIDYFTLHDGKDKWYDINYKKMSFAIKYIEKIKYVTTLEFVNCAKDIILNILRKEGYLTFSDYLIYLRDTLKKDASCEGTLIKHIYNRHRYYLIDEFQDTDPIQAEIFFYLSAKNPKSNWQECIPHEGSLFIVGDPKQSIYRFKNADVSSYLKVEKMFENPEIGEVLHLYKNFRSTKEIRSWFNEKFTYLLPTNTSDQAKYENIPIDDDDLFCGDFTGVYKYDIGNKDKDETKITEMLLKICNNPDILIKKKYKINDEIIYKSEQIDWKDIMIITPTKSSLSNYSKELRDNNIPCFIEGNIDFNQSDALVLLVDYFKAITDVKDNRCLYKILKSDIYKIKEIDLVNAISDGFKLNLETDIENLSLANDLRKALNELKAYSIKARKLSSSSLFSLLIEKINVFEKVSDKNMEYIYFVLEQLKNKENNNEIIIHDDAYKYFERILSSQNDQERCFGLQADNNKVHIANLHKVKGLEAPVVILVHPKGKEKAPNFRMDRGTTNKGYLFNIYKRTNNYYSKIINTDLYDHPYKDDETNSINAENIRLQYVASTRAKNVLIISNLVIKDGGMSTSNPWYELVCGSELKDIDDVICDNDTKEKEKEAIEYEKNKSILENNDLGKSSYELVNPSKVINNDEIIDAEISRKRQKQIDENNGESKATISGTIVHRLMEYLIMSKNKDCDKNRLFKNIIDESITAEYYDQRQYFTDILDKVYSIIRNGGFDQKGEAPKDILNIILSSKEAYSEVPFTYESKGKLYDGIIDLLYLKDDKYHIIDFKTNKNDRDLDNHYKNQLDCYKRAIEECLKIDIEDALIYHIDIS